MTGKTYHAMYMCRGGTNESKNQKYQREETVAYLQVQFPAPILEFNFFRKVKISKQLLTMLEASCLD